MNKNILLSLCCLLAYGLHAQQSYKINFTHDGKKVFGTFKVPKGNKRFKTIIINPGSGANDRYGTMHMTGANVACLYPGLLGDTLRPYDELSDALQTAGYAVLIYDKLEFTYSSTLGTITFHKLWLPVESAIEYVKSRADVDTNNIILIGHSEGSSLIPYISRHRKDIRALISIAGSRTPFDSLLAYQIVNITQTCGGDVSAAKTQAQQILDYFTLIRTNTFNNTTPDLFGVPASVWRDYVLATDPVADFYDSCRLPTLFIGLEKDINVPPSELLRFKSEVAITNDFWEIPSLIHYMVPNNVPHVANSLTDTIVYWLRSNGLRSNVATLSAIDQSIQIFPVPVQSYIEIVLRNPNADEVSFTLRDMTGKIIVPSVVVKNHDHTLQYIDMSTYQSGVYFVEFTIDGQVFVKKILKY